MNALPALPPLWNATSAELEAYAELDELAAQWRALSDWDALERRRAVYRQYGTPGVCVVSTGTAFLGLGGGVGGASTFANTVSGLPAPDFDEPEPSTQRSSREADRVGPEDPFPLVRRKRPSWFDFAFRPSAERRSPGHAHDDPAQLPRPRFRS